MVVWTPSMSGARVEPFGATTPSVPLGIKRASITFDRTWAPYIQGTLVCSRQTSAQATTTDPRNPLLAKLTLKQIQVGGPTQTLDLVTYLRTRVNDFATDEATLSVASIESIMQDHGDINGNAYAADTADTVMLNDALRGMQVFNDGTLTLSTADTPASFTVAKADAAWDAGTPVWDVVNGIEQPKSIWLHGDETGKTLFRHAAGFAADTSVHYLYGKDTNGIPGRVLTVQDTIDRDSPDWANSVFIDYTWNKGLSVASDYATPGSPRLLKTVVINRKGRRTSTGEAAARAARMVKRGRTLVVTAIADLTCRPNQQHFVGFRDVTWYGIVRAVTFRWPEGLMDLTIDITESSS